ncbi:MAG: hypothetical protein ACI97P_002840, partial [Arcticibacterium sp.]
GSSLDKCLFWVFFNKSFPPFTSEEEPQSNKVSF